MSRVPHRRGDGRSRIGHVPVAGPVAPDALFELGAALGRLGQTSQACVTLSEVKARFPVAEATTKANAEMTTLGCS